MDLELNQQKFSFFEKVFGGSVPGSKNNIQVRCPKCESEHKKLGTKLQKYKLAILMDGTDVFHCWVCGYSGGIAKAIREYKPKEYYKEYLSRFASKITIKNEEDQKQNQEEKVRLPSDFRLLANTEGGLYEKAAKKYLRKRGVSESQLWFFKFGISDQYPWTNRVLMPSFDEVGELNYICGRDISGVLKVPYWDSSINKKHLIFNEINVDWQEELTIVEGIFDLVKCNENAVPLLGSDLDYGSFLFLKLIQEKTPVLLALDADMQQTKVPKIVNKLTGFGLSVRVLNLGNRKDVGEMSKQEFLQRRRAATVMSVEEKLKRKLFSVSSKAVI